MNKLLLSTLAAFAFIAPAQAGVLLPNLYASEYCSMRDAGLSKGDSIRVATSAALIEGEPVIVERDGKKYDADVVQSSIAVAQLCPQHL